MTRSVSDWRRAAYSAGSRAALIKLSFAPNTLNPLAWADHAEGGVSNPEKPLAQEILQTGASVLNDMATTPERLNQPVPRPDNLIPPGGLE